MAAATFALVRLGMTSPAQQRQLLDFPAGPAQLLTVGRPLPTAASQVSLAHASSVLGAPVTLPDSAQASSSDVGAVWTSRLTHSEAGESIAVTFPSQGFAVRYTRPAYSDPLADYESYVQNTPTAQVVYLDGVPALTDTSTRPDGSTWGFVEFVDHGTVIAVMGTASETILQAAAKSILNRDASS